MSWMPWSAIRQTEGESFVTWAVGRLDPPSVFAKGRSRTWKEAQAVCSLNRARQESFAGQLLTRDEMFAEGG